MDLPGSRLFQHMDQIGDGGSSHNRIVHQHDPFSPYHRIQNTELHMHAGFSLLLRGFDKSPADIAVFIKGEAKGNPGRLGESFRRRNTGFRNTRNQIRIRRVGLCQQPPAPDPGVIDI